MNKGNGFRCPFVFHFATDQHVRGNISSFPCSVFRADGIDLLEFLLDHRGLAGMGRATKLFCPAGRGACHQLTVPVVEAQAVVWAWSPAAGVSGGSSCWNHSIHSLATASISSPQNMLGPMQSRMMIGPKN